MLASASTPPPVLTPAPITITSTPAPVMTKTPAPSLKTPGPVAAANRDPNSVLPTIPAARKEPSGAFPLPGMAPLDGKSTDEDTTLIARLSVLDDTSDESTKVEPLEAALRAAATKDEPIALAEQASAERERALSVSAADRVSASEFEEPGDDDELTVSATPGIISIADEDDDEEDTTASQRPQGGRPKTPAPVLGGATPAPLLGGPRLPAPSPVPGRTIKLPTPSGGLSALGATLPPPSPQRSVTPALPIPAPQGAPAAPTTAARSVIFKLIPLPLGSLVGVGIALFVAGAITGAVFTRNDAPVAEVPAPAPTAKVEPAAAEPAAAPAANAEPAPAPAANVAPTAAEPKVAAPAPVEPNPAPTVANEPPAPTPEPNAAAEEAKPVRHAAARPKVVRKPIAAAPEAKPAAEKPDPPMSKLTGKPAPAAKPVAAAKPAGKGGDKGKKTWVDPFAE
jgi:hypothetical protein